jgi:hypothetical protein
MWTCGGTEVRPELDLSTLAAISKDLGFKCIDEAIRSRSSASRGMLTDCARRARQPRSHEDRAR